MQWVEEDLSICSSPSFSLSPDPLKLMVVRSNSDPLVVYKDGVVEVLGGAKIVLGPHDQKDWLLTMAECSSDSLLCVVGTLQSRVTVGIAQLVLGQWANVSVSTVLSDKCLVGSCICQDRLLLLCK